jgi:hypothetical protein
VEEESGVLLAAFHARFLETEEHVLGTLVVTVDGKRLLGVDLVVVMGLVMQERSDEGNVAVRYLWRVWIDF